MNESYFKDLLKKNGLKVTSQRLIVLEAVASCPGKHLSAEEIYDLVHESYPEVGLATVYRTLQVLLELHMIDKVNFDDGVVRYEMCEQSETARHRHHHLICKKCGKVYAFEDDPLDNLERTILLTTGFEVVDHEVKLYGYCRDCIEKEQM